MSLHPLDQTRDRRFIVDTLEILDRTDWSLLEEQKQALVHAQKSLAPDRHTYDLLGGLHEWIDTVQEAFIELVALVDLNSPEE